MLNVVKLVSIVPSCKQEHNAQNYSRNKYYF